MNADLAHVSVDAGPARGRTPTSDGAEPTIRIATPTATEGVLAPAATEPIVELRDIDHAQHPVGRVGRPEDVAALCAYLASNDAGFITGQTFVVDGGMTRKMIYEE